MDFVIVLLTTRKRFFLKKNVMKDAEAVEKVAVLIDGMEGSVNTLEKRTKK